jgi:glutamate 5-kinase
MAEGSTNQPISGRAGLPGARRLVVKVGSAVLAPRGELDEGAVSRLAGGIAGLTGSGREVVLVSSGAVASGYQLLGLKRKPRTIVEKQAAAAVGQQRLMRAYAEAFGARGLTVAQVLLTADDIDHRMRFLNARRTLRALLEHKVVPILNENDSVSFEEIKLGDNDNLSALVASLVQADALVILSTVPGVLARGSGEVVSVVEKPDDALAHVTKAKSATGVGGMETKVGAARTAGAAGIPTIVAGGNVEGILGRVLGGEDVGTFFVPRGRAAALRKRWIGLSARPKGSLVVDAGARVAIVQRGASLLPSGVVGVRGEFAAGAPIEIRTRDGSVFARGICSYAADEVRLIRGCKASEIESVLGYAYADEVVHRDNLSVLDSGSGVEGTEA